MVTTKNKTGIVGIVTSDDATWELHAPPVPTNTAEVTVGEELADKVLVAESRDETSAFMGFNLWDCPGNLYLNDEFQDPASKYMQAKPGKYENLCGGSSDDANLKRAEVMLR